MIDRVVRKDPPPAVAMRKHLLRLLRNSARHHRFPLNRLIVYTTVLLLHQPTRTLPYSGALWIDPWPIPLVVTVLRLKKCQFCLHVMQPMKDHKRDANPILHMAIAIGTPSRGHLEIMTTTLLVAMTTIKIEGIRYVRIHSRLSLGRLWMLPCRRNEVPEREPTNPWTMAWDHPKRIPAVLVRIVNSQTETTKQKRLHRKNVDWIRCRRSTKISKQMSMFLKQVESFECRVPIDNFLPLSPLGEETSDIAARAVPIGKMHPAIIGTG